MSKVYKQFIVMPVISTCSYVRCLFCFFSLQDATNKDSCHHEWSIHELPRHVRNPRGLAAPAQFSLVLPKTSHSPGPDVSAPGLSASTLVKLQQGQSPAPHSPAQPSDGPKSQPDFTPSPGKCPMPGLEPFFLDV